MKIRRQLTVNSRQRFKKAVILIGHGSPLKGFEAPMKKVAARLRETRDYSLVRCAYLTRCEPSMDKAVADCIREGARALYLVPYFLLIGNHVEHDIPRIVSAIKKKYKNSAKIKLCAYLGYDAKIAQVVQKRVRAAR